MLIKSVCLGAIFSMMMAYSASSQLIEDELDVLIAKLTFIQQQESRIKSQVDSLKLFLSKSDFLKYAGLPSEDYLAHSAYFFEYSEQHEQSKWVAHTILPEIVNIGKGRTNDFREDPLVVTGTAIEKDYFLKTLKQDSTYEYDGYGFDRGHLAASADFRWSGPAVSENYYSNMSPMRPGFNREIWADLEKLMRNYVFRNKVPLYVVTAPLLTDDLEKIKRSINGVSIPKKFIKVALDLVNNRSIGFVISNRKIDTPLDAFAVPVDYIEEISGYNFFPLINESIEKSTNKSHWFTDESADYVDPIQQEQLSRGRLNTFNGGFRRSSHKKITVCGTVVSSRYSRSGSAWLNLDRQYPNDYFSIMIKKEYLTDFDYDPVKVLIDEERCFEGEVLDLGGKPVIIVERQGKISEL